MTENATHIEIIEPPKGWRFVNWRELWRYRDLFLFLVWRDIKARYAQSVLGIGWAVIQPVFRMIVFTIIFGKLAGIQSDGAPYAVFSYIALVPWTYFSGALSGAGGSIVGASGMLTKVYFPRMVIPLSSVLSKLVDFVIAFFIVGILLLWYRIPPTPWAMATPLLVLQMMLTAVGMGMWLTALSVQYRDVSYALGFLIQLMMYLSPVVYPVSLIPESYHALYALNPMAGVIQGFRAAYLGTVDMPLMLIGIGWCSTILITVTGCLYFQKMEKIFADVV